MSDESAPDAHSLQKRMNALEKMRGVETRIVQHSLPLIRRLTIDLQGWLSTPLPQQIMLDLEKGEMWWQDLDDSYGDHDPRCFPVVRETIARLPIDLSPQHFANQPVEAGQCYRDLIIPIREQVLRRTELRHIAGTP